MDGGRVLTVAALHSGWRAQTQRRNEHFVSSVELTLKDKKGI